MHMQQDTLRDSQSQLTCSYSQQQCANSCHVAAVQKSLKKGEYLWELISPKEKDGLPARSTSGRYRVKLFLLVSTTRHNSSSSWNTATHKAEP
jgi:hypothetical protein